ncbi:MAG TPA: acyltransferase, partial [Cellvibrionaceae bacterium]|nr:acyltransferase [Cellvibrionaceae bacterium]
MSTPTRLPALDCLRAFAIIIVLLYHYKVVVSSEDTFGYITQIGWMGVDLFFVLSGYLIGDQILGPLARQEPFSIGRFYLRRLLRTLPNYYAVCLLYIFGPDILIGNHTSDWWRFLTFTQNFDFRPGVTFSHSWSLCIEEQFYLIWPVLLWFCHKKNLNIFTVSVVIATLSFGLNTYGVHVGR